MPDPKFSEPRLARLYDVTDADRSDLGPYRDLVAEFLDRPGRRRVLDVGCGTGVLAVLLATDPGLEVTGVDPAGASLDVARGKPGAGRVRWIEATAPDLPGLDPPVVADLAVMTGNVAQVFLTDDDWLATLTALRSVLAPDGRLVFESRRPERRAWERWRAETEGGAATSVWQVPGEGEVRESREFLEVDLPFVTFGGVYTFPDGTELRSRSTLRFRTADEIADDLAATGFTLLEVRDAPDRPGLENVFVCAVAEPAPGPA